MADDLYLHITNDASLIELVKSMAAQVLQHSDIGNVVYQMFAVYQATTTLLNKTALTALIVRCFNTLAATYNLLPPAGVLVCDHFVSAAVAVCLNVLPALEAEVVAATTSCWKKMTGCCKPTFSP